MPSLKYHLRFPEEKVPSPIVYEIGKEYPVVTNIRGANVTETTGWLNLELTGEIADIERAVEGLKQKGIQVDPIELDVIE
ncbi:MAG TPA: FeS-binding protein [Nitrospirales bacterium]|jgi:ABC-type methionine transport system ATPase subunit|nr:FeS-binding protein [Nitrospirales bacterium]HIA14106.1 FeS-binding protein [Nitrospirales bacterium]HIB55204.1 FeS-binding protein [Nitrospirales bacterium]HIC04810.1 FeS-binding protein [Nitrospirales bacterium]HIN33097.1 FeS-binding protein [Nitrospirales bacterium]